MAAVVVGHGAASGALLSEPAVGLHDVLHDLVPHHVPPPRWQNSIPSMSSRISWTTESPLACPLGEVGLGDVAVDHGLGSEPEPGEEHLHLLRRGVLRLVQDDERIIQGVVGHEEVVGDVQRILGPDLDAHGLRHARRFDAVDEPHRAATATERPIGARLPREAERR